MGSGLLCWVTLCVLGVGHTRAGVVSQSPGYRVAGRGQTVNFRCDPIPGHQVLYWYRQMLGQGPEYLTNFQGKEEPDKSGMPKNRFSAERPESTYSYLKIQPVEPEDSALYLCASSPTTAQHSHLLPVHKPLRAHFSSWFPEMPEKGATCSSLCRGSKWIWGFSCSDSWRSENYL
uniref:Ig-like domain-containing protein n=1 Tax=Bos mutus grunniens TaxID=30521 RepID=A0A8B9WC19_BOSMU